tara:strand:- start:612 stop:815 length:204 start_codon:yes stop_codon:yes gene_type:complete
MQRILIKNNIVKELELNGWEVRASLWHTGLDIEKNRFVCMGTENDVLGQAKNLGLGNWVALEETEND